MNRPTDNSELKTAPLDRILSSEPELMPSSGFLAAVMERVEEESVAPAPIPFPWRRAIPGIVLAIGVFAWAGFELVRQGAGSLQAFAFTSPRLPAALQQSLEPAVWVLLALALALISWLFSRRLSGQSELL